MPYFGNKEIPDSTIRKLQEYFYLRAQEENSEIRLKPRLESYTKEQVGILLLLLAGLGADEVDKEEDGWVRLWWD